jgi:hypothetical protein
MAAREEMKARVRARARARAAQQGIDLNLADEEDLQRHPAVTYGPTSTTNQFY